jgi:hypothetical protein
MEMSSNVFNAEEEEDTATVYAIPGPPPRDLALRKKCARQGMGNS